MKISFKNFSFFADAARFDKSKPQVLFIHGFTGSSIDWNEILPGIDDRFSLITIDLIGHGKSDSPDEINFYEINSIIQQIKKLIDELAINKVILAGYSMGGRVALNFAVSYPEKISGLILESTNPGIEDEQERFNRFRSDEKLADKIIAEGIESFVEHWMNLPIFESQKLLPREKIESLRKNKINNNPVGLANSLAGFSTGRMNPLWGELENLNFPALLLAGEKDSKYVSINEQMNRLLPNSEFHIVQSAGHNTHLEKPTDFVILVNRFLRTNFV